MPIVFDDGRMGAAFHLRVTPQHIVIGRDGRIRYVGNLADRRLDSALADARTVNSGDAMTRDAGHAPPAPISAIGLGDRLPDQSVTTLDGKSFRLRNPGAPQPTVLVFLSPWCESYLSESRPAISARCRAAREQVEALASSKNVRWLGIASGLWAATEDLRKYQTEQRIQIPLTLDESGVLFRAFRVTRVPVIVVADATGKIVNRMDSDDTRDLRRVLGGL